MVAPCIVQLVGEYVPEILEAIRASCLIWLSRAFMSQSPRRQHHRERLFLAQTERRMVNYGVCYDLRQ